METTAAHLLTPHRFIDRVADASPTAINAARIDSLMLNVGLRCDMACRHCHQSSSPARTETMSRETMLQSLRFAELLRPDLIDITGGEPTLWEHLPELVTSARAAGFDVRVRTNLIALAHPDRAHLPAFFAEQGVALMASLPGTTPGDVAEQRGQVFAAVIDVLRDLADLGYGSDPALTLDLAYNPPLGELARPEAELTREFRSALQPLGVRFSTLRVIANVPAGRYALLLKDAGGYQAELDRLAGAFNPDVLGELVCRCSVEVVWDGTLTDCDFNLGAGLRVADGPRTVAEALALADTGDDVRTAIATRRIAFGPHCFACTAGAGSG